MKTPDQHLRQALRIVKFTSLGATIAVLAGASDQTRAVWFGYSGARLILAGGFLLSALLAAGANRFLAAEPTRAGRVQIWLAQPPVFALGQALAFLITVVSGYVLALTHALTDASLRGPAERLIPFLVWSLLLALVVSRLLLQLRAGPGWVGRLGAGLPWKPIGVAAAGLALAAVLVARTGIGRVPDQTGWDTPGAPLLASQVFLAWAGGIVMLLLAGELTRRWPRPTDLGLAGLIWLTAVLVWQAQPLAPTYFSPDPRPPNYEFYPYSDAALLEVNTQNLLIGEGFVYAAEKPLYNLFLALLHTLVGPGYLPTVQTQTLVLALFPAVVYALGSTLGHRLAGVLAAGLLILREQNTLQLSGRINVSHSQLLMTDLPAALGVSLLILLLVFWARARRDSSAYAAVAGAGLGLLLLLRPQLLLFVGVIVAVLALALWRDRVRLLRSAALFLLALALVLAPWWVRNGLKTGSPGFDLPFSSGYLARQYSFTAGLEAGPASPAGFQAAAEFALAHPGAVVRFIGAHFFHNEISALLALPSEFSLVNNLNKVIGLRDYYTPETTHRLWAECCGLRSWVQAQPYWDSLSPWDGEFPARALPPLAFNLTLIAVGIGVAWRRLGPAGLIPLGFHLVYSLSTAIARVSGWRLILPVDWVAILYYSIGLAAVTLWVWRAFRMGAPAPQPPPAAAPAVSARLAAGLVLGMFAVGLALPLVEIALPQRYAGLQPAPPLDGLEWRVGRALFPRYYPGGVGEPGGDWPAFNPLPFSRVGFYLAGPQNEHVILPLNQSPTDFPHAVDVFVYGCVSPTYFLATEVVLQQADGTITILADLARPNCADR